MQIDSYKFGKIVINGQMYEKDLIILPNRIIPNWWRKEGHFICIEDIKSVIESNPQILFIGTGKFGMMKVANSLKSILTENGIELRIDKTPKIIKMYNKTVNNHKAAALHLTC
jgi:hypothetical protein